MGERLTPGGLIVLVSSIYLMIRAFDNIKKGLEERGKKKEEDSEEASVTPETPKQLSFCPPETRISEPALSTSRAVASGRRHSVHRIGAMAFVGITRTTSTHP